MKFWVIVSFLRIQFTITLNSLFTARSFGQIIIKWTLAIILNWFLTSQIIFCVVVMKTAYHIILLNLAHLASAHKIFKFVYSQQHQSLNCSNIFFFFKKRAKKALIRGVGISVGNVSFSMYLHSHVNSLPLLGSSIKKIKVGADLTNQEILQSARTKWASLVYWATQHALPRESVPWIFPAQFFATNFQTPWNSRSLRLSGRGEEFTYTNFNLKFSGDDIFSFCLRGF